MLQLKRIFITVSRTSLGIYMPGTRSSLQKVPRAKSSPLAVARAGVLVRLMFESQSGELALQV